MASAGGKHPQVLDFVINKEQALDLEVNELVGRASSVIEALFRDIEKIKSLGLDVPHDRLMELKSWKAQREFRQSDEFRERVRKALGI